MRSLLELDKELLKLQDVFTQVAGDVSFSKICTLDHDEEVNKQRYAGIYLIEICTAGDHKDLSGWYNAFQEAWEHPDFRAKFTPNTRKKRIGAHYKLLEWMPLYVGKSKEIAARVRGHIDLGFNSKTFALKLRARIDHIKLADLRLSTIDLSSVSKKNYNIIAPTLEHAMRNRLNPLVGKQ